VNLDAVLAELLAPSADAASLQMVETSAAPAVTTTAEVVTKPRAPRINAVVETATMDAPLQQIETVAKTSIPAVATSAVARPRTPVALQQSAQNEAEAVPLVQIETKR
jgi:hypothetical protein